MLLVDDGQRQILEGHPLLHQRMGPDHDGNVAPGQTGKQPLPGLALVASGQQRGFEPGRLGQRLDGGEVLARQDFGWRHQRGLKTRLDRRQHGQERHHGLAAADIALQQAQHAVVTRHVGGDFGIGEALRAGQLVGQGGDYPVAELARAGDLPSWQAALMRPHQLESELIGEELVIGEAGAGRRRRVEIGLALRRHSGSSGLRCRAA